MKIFKKLFLVLSLITAILVISFVLYGFYMKPKYEGTLNLKGISKKTTVYFDEFGIPHIYANSEKDAMTVLGYVHAQDRLWQMELLRRIAPGKLSELFGTKALNNDRLFCGLGIEEASEKAINNLDKESQSYELTMAYLDGINQFIDEGVTPVEFQLLGLEKEKFTIKDVFNIFGYMSFSFAMAQKTDPFLTYIKDKYGEVYLKDLGLETKLEAHKSEVDAEKAKQFLVISVTINNLLEKAPFSSFVGSNSWVIGPQKTLNKKVIFANDPHIGNSQPGTWYEAHIVTPNHESYGCYLSGAPFPLLGHNREYAYGITMFENDDADFYYEENNPNNKNQYVTSSGFQDYKIRRKTIKVRDSSDFVFETKVSRHGPLMNNLMEGLDSARPIAFSWLYTQQPIGLLEASYRVSHAENINDFQNGLKLIASPGLNLMYGDNKGNVGRWGSAKLYRHKPGVNPNFILKGSSAEEEISEYFDFSKNPSSVNPSCNYVYSANFKPDPIDGFSYPGYYLPQDRGNRIKSLLNNKSNWNKSAVASMILDNTSTVSVEVVKCLIANININEFSGTEKDAMVFLKKWKGSSELDDIGPTIYNKWVYFYLKNTFEDEMGEKAFGQFLKTYLMHQVFSEHIFREHSVWWDDLRTKNKKESRSNILTKAFKEAVKALELQMGAQVSEWVWGKIHQVEYKHPFGEIAPLKRLFNVGPIQISGSNEVINNQFFDYTATMINLVKGGPSSRRIIDFSDIENSLGILPTGQSGNPFSSHYDDQVKLFINGKFRKMKLNKNEIVRSSSKLVFLPTKK